MLSPKPVLCSVPGKLILAGEHSVVHGRPALVAAVDARLTVRVSAGRCDGVELCLEDLGHQSLRSVEELMGYAQRQRQVWSEYIEQPTSESFARLHCNEPDHLVKLAVAEALRLAHIESVPNLRLEIHSQMPVGSGFGSSAALAVGVVAALLAALGVAATAAEIEAAALAVERFQHGTPSGLDSIAVSRGGMLWLERIDGELVPIPVEVDRHTVGCFTVLDSGRPAESTGEVVSAVRSLEGADEKRFGELMETLDSSTRRLHSGLVGGRSETIEESLRCLHAALTGLGVVPPPVVELVEGVERRGGAAKISGAGALSGNAAGSLLVYHPDPDFVVGCEFLAGLPRLDADLGCQGLRIEPLGGRGGEMGCA